MTVVDIAAWREKNKKNQTGNDVDAESRPANKSDIALAADYVMTEWMKAIRAGNLNQYFSSALGLIAGEYVDDLNALSSIESDEGIDLAIFHPGTSPIAENVNGYSVILRVHDHAVSTPLMLTEANARAFAILFYRELELGGVI